MSNNDGKTKRAVLKLSDVTESVDLAYEGIIRGTNKYGQYVGFLLPPDRILFISSTHKAFNRVMNAPNKGILSVRPKVTASKRVFYDLYAHIPMREDNRKP